VDILDVDALIRDVSSEAPCGEDLSYDPEYSEIERAMSGSPERQIGDELLEASEPDWRDVKKKCQKIFTRTKDLRMALNLALALMQTEGLAGLRDGLAVISELIEKRWDSFHPQLDPDDDNDPVERINIIASLAPEGGFQDPFRFPQRLLDVTICNSPQMGRFSIEDVMLARGELSPAKDAETPDPAQVDAAFATADPEQMSSDAAAIVEVDALIGKIESSLSEQVGLTSVPDLSKLSDPVKRILEILKEKVPLAFGDETSADPTGEAGAEGGSVESSTASAAGAPAATLSGEITSRDDVIRALDKVTSYYSRYEPSSPVPLLVQRARRLVTKSFIEVIEDLTPDAMKQIKLIGGDEGGE
jgi:type VI secretion system protein ImpA